MIGCRIVQLRDPPSLSFPKPVFHRTQTLQRRTMLLRRAVLSTRVPIRCRRDVLPCRQFSSSLPRRGLIEITIDGKKVMVEQGAALIQACEIAGVQIPR